MYDCRSSQIELTSYTLMSTSHCHYEAFIVIGCMFLPLPRLSGCENQSGSNAPFWCEFSLHLLKHSCDYPPRSFLGCSGKRLLFFFLFLFFIVASGFVILNWSSWYHIFNFSFRTWRKIGTVWAQNE